MKTHHWLAATILLYCLIGTYHAGAEWVWVEGENPATSSFNRHPWYDQVDRKQFSGGNFLSNFNQTKPGEATYNFKVHQGGEYEFWLRANPIQASLSYWLNNGPEEKLDLTKNGRDVTNVAADHKPDLRFLAWFKLGKVTLKSGDNTIRFRTTSKNNFHGYIDCFAFANEPFEPQGANKPGQVAVVSTADGWFPFNPPADVFGSSPLDLRHLNEKFAGEHGFIQTKGGHFIRSGDQQEVRFWGVNGPPHDLTGDELRHAAKLLAKRGVNLARIHGGMFDAKGEVDPKKIQHAFEMVEILKSEGIYSHFSIYFPLWLQPRPDNTWLPGYDGRTKPFAALFFHKGFQQQYRKWWTELLTTPNPKTGKKLIDEPAVFGLEMQNEDSFFFWTFKPEALPEGLLCELEQQFGDWLKQRYGSLEKARTRWNGLSDKRDDFAAGRVGFRPIWNMFNQKTPRDQDTARFLYETQSRFYAETYAFLRSLGFKGVITASNWTTASAEILGPLEKLSYTTGDFIDRHGYFSSNHKGDSSEWSIRNNHTYANLSALRFDGNAPGKPKEYNNPVMDPKYADKPSMISETTFNRPNRYRTEGPLYFAAYGALQDSDAIIHFAFDGAQWSVKPGFYMQPWTLMSPTMIGQFPAAALIYREGLVLPGSVVANITLNTNELLSLKGTPLPQGASLDELRAKDLPKGNQVKAGQRIDPLVHFVGRTQIHFSAQPAKVELGNLGQYINRSAQTVISSNHELDLDYRLGVLKINAPQAQGAVGNLKADGEIKLADLTLQSPMDLGAIIVVSLDGQPLASSKKMLLQVMSEEKPSGFATQPAENGRFQIKDIGHNPWLFKELQGQVQFTSGSSALHVTPLDLNGYPQKPLKSQGSIALESNVVYYLIER